MQSTRKSECVAQTLRKLRACAEVQGQPQSYKQTYHNASAFHLASALKPVQLPRPINVPQHLQGRILTVLVRYC